MTPSPPDGFLTRPEAAASYNRSKRALERDLDAAMRMQDDDVLAQFKLLTKDGEVRQAAQVTTNQVEKLKAEGMNPIWYVRTEWLEEKYGRKGSPRPDRAQQQPYRAPSAEPVREFTDADTDFSSPGKEPADTRDHNPTVVGLLRERIQELESDKKRLEKELDRSYELRKEDNDLRVQGNALMAQLTELLGGRSLKSLPTPQPPSPQATQRTARPTAEPSAPDKTSGPVAAAVVVDKKVRTPSARAAVAHKNRTSSKAPASPKKSAKQPAAKRATAPQQQSQKQPDQEPTPSTLFPTFQRLRSRLFPRKK